MKKIVLMLVAAFFMGGAVMAQHARVVIRCPIRKFVPNA